MDTTISILRNQFDNATKGNFKRMIMAAADHFDKLKQAALTNPQIDVIYQNALPAYQKYTTKYQQITSNYALYQGHTQLFEEKILELRSTLIRKWDIIIQYEYDETSAQYKMLLPNGRMPFQTGAYELRLNAVSSLLANVQAMNNPNFANLIQIIDAWLQQAYDLRAKQQGFEATDSLLRQEIENDRKALANAMHLVFFQLCVNFYPNLAQVETFYEWKYFKAAVSNTNANGITKTVSVAAASRITADVNNYQDNTNINVENKGDVVIEAWISASENSPAPVDVSFINVGENANFIASELSDGTSPMKFLILNNKDANNGGKVALEIGGGDS